MLNTVVVNILVQLLCSAQFVTLEYIQFIYCVSFMLLFLSNYIKKESSTNILLFKAFWKTFIKESVKLNSESFLEQCNAPYNSYQLPANCLLSYLSRRECNSRHSVFDVINLFYTIVINYVYVVWTEQNKTLKDSGILLKGIWRT